MMLMMLVNCQRNVKNYSAIIYLLQVNTRNTRERCEICSKLTIKTLEWRLDVSLMFLLLTLNIFCVFVVFLLLLWTCKCLLTSLWFYLGNLAGISEDDIKQLITSMQVLEIVASNLQESLTERVGIGFLLMVLKSHSQLPKKLFYLLQWKPFKDLKMMKNVFYFMLKAYFLPTPTGQESF